MQSSQSYMLTVKDLFTMPGGVICGADAEIAIMDGNIEIDRLTISGKCQSKDGYRRSYIARPGLSAKLIAGPGEIHFESNVGAGFTPAV